MNNKRIRIFCIFIAIFLTGCTLLNMNGKKNINDTKNESKITVEQEQEELASKEFLIETFLITEEDIEKYDVEELISYFELTEDFFLHEKENLEDLSSITIDFERLQKKMIKELEEEQYDFSYLIESEEFEGEFPDIETIRYLVVSDQVGTGGTSFVMDFEKNIIYDSSNSANVYTNIQYADKEVVLTEERKNEIIQALKDSEIWEWDYMYSDKSEVGMASWWHLGVEFQNGTVISYNGAGKVPDNYMNLEKVLFKR